MKKENLLGIVIGTFGGIILSTGICIALVEGWHLTTLGIGIAIVGMLMILSTIIIYKELYPQKNKNMNWGIIITLIIEVIGAVTMSYGKSRLFVERTDMTTIITGLILALLGLTVCILAHPIYWYTKTENAIVNKVLYKKED